MDGSVQPETWEQTLAGVAEYVAMGERNAEPIAYVLGAGASLSSAAPATAAVAARFDRLTQGRFGDDPVTRRRALEHVTEHEKRLAIEDLFDDVVPYVGYRCLAAQGFTRRVYVLTFNWDLALETACLAVGVEFESVSLGQPHAELERALSGEDARVVIVHAHGQWDRQDIPLAWGTLETLSFPDAEQALLAERVLRHATIVIGASLADDTDMHELIRTLSADALPTADLRPLWILGRSEIAGPAGGVASEWLVSRRSRFNHVTAAQVDFDRAMVAIRAAQCRLPFGAVQRETMHLDLPDWSTIVWPEPSLLRPHLDASVVALVAEPKLGKSTVGHLLAWWRGLWSSAPKPPVSVVGPGPTMKALAAIESAPGSSPPPLVIDDPFGADAAKPNEGLMPAIERLTASASRPAVVICSRLANWSVASADPPAAMAQASCEPAAWYDEASLMDFLRSFESDEEAAWAELVRSRELNTPARIEAAAVSGFAPDARDPGNVADKRSLLLESLVDEDQRSAGLLVVLARLQQLVQEPKTRDDLEAAIGGLDETLPVWHRLRGMLHSFVASGTERIKLNHSTDGEAVDRLLVEHRAEAEAALDTLGPSGRWAQRALDLFDTLAAIDAGDLSQVMQLPAAVRSAAATTLIQRATASSASAGWDVIDWLLDDPGLDFWALCDLVYEVFRMWRTLAREDANRSRADRFVTKVLADSRRMGTYAVLEATLYLQRVTPEEIWLPLCKAVMELARSDEDHDFELALLFDGLVWRPPAVDERTRQQLFNPLLEAARRRRGLVGAYAFACAYHPQGAMFVRDRWPDSTIASRGPLDPEQTRQAARLMRFHFVHQSRARALLARRPYEGGELGFLFQTLYPGSLGRQRAEAIVSLIEEMAAHGVSDGWGTHLALNVGTTQGTFTQRQLDRLAGCLPAAADDALLAGVITHEWPRGLRQRLRALVATDAGRSAVLDRLRDGFHFDGWHVRPPRYQFVRDIGQLHDNFGIEWEQLRTLGEIDVSDPDQLVVRYETVAEEAVALGAPADAVVSLLDRIRAGDWRDIEAAAAARGGDDRDPHLRSLLAAVALYSPQAELL